VIKNAGEGGGCMLNPCIEIKNACKLENILTMISVTKNLARYHLKL
jgi:hypothetical protein